jgi:MATE family multidrug resistance protein
MEASRAALRKELRPMTGLAVPVVLAELGWIAMGVVDTVMVGRVSAEAIGAVGVGSILFFAVGIFGTGLLLGLDTLVPQAFGADDLEDCHHTLFQAVYLCLGLAPILMVLMSVSVPLLRGWGLHPDVLELAIPYIRVVIWSALPLLLFTAFRHYLQGMNLVRPIMVVLVSANLVNVFANWLLIFGKLGFPAMGAEGAGWATCISRVYMCLGLLAYILYRERRYDVGLSRRSLALDVDRIRHLTRLGFPAALQRGLEIGVFAMATALIGRLDPVSLAAHQIAINIASVTFMVPLGISSAGAVRVGQALGRRDPQAARRSGWTALFLSSAFMSVAGLTLLLIPRVILRGFTTDPAVIATGVTLLFIAAIFQLFDGLQVVATGVLRGAGDTRTAVVTNVVGHWLLGLPIGYVLCFELGWGAPGLWVGLSVGLIAVGVLLLYVWAQRVELKPQIRRMAA